MQDSKDTLNHEQKKGIKPGNSLYPLMYPAGSRFIFFLRMRYLLRFLMQTHHLFFHPLPL
jgi:hypothetical protein